MRADLLLYIISFEETVWMFLGGTSTYTLFCYIDNIPLPPPTAVLNVRIIFFLNVMHRFLSSRQLHLLISSSLFNLSFISLSSPPRISLFFFFSSLSLLFLLLQGHDDAAPCAVLKRVDSFSFLQHPVHQRSLEILQRCKEEKHSKAANTTITPPTFMSDYDLWRDEANQHQHNCTVLQLVSSQEKSDHNTKI